MPSGKWLLRDIAWWLVAIIEFIGFFLFYLSRSPTLRIAGAVIMLLGAMPTMCASQLIRAVGQTLAIGIAFTYAEG